MKTHTLVQASAEVITIITLTAGDTYKRLIKKYNDSYEAVYGIVRSVDFNGEQAMVTAIEIGQGEVSIHTFGTDSELGLFATDPTELAIAATQVLQTLDYNLDSARRAVTKASQAISDLKNVQRLISTGAARVPTVETKAVGA